MHSNYFLFNLYKTRSFLCPAKELHITWNHKTNLYNYNSFACLTYSPRPARTSHFKNVIIHQCPIIMCRCLNNNDNDNIIIDNNNDIIIINDDNNNNIWETWSDRGSAATKKNFFHVKLQKLLGSRPGDVTHSWVSKLDNNHTVTQWHDHLWAFLIHLYERILFRWFLGCLGLERAKPRELTCSVAK